MSDFFLPVLSHFQNKNPWTASAGRMRYRIIPTVAENDHDSILTAEVWEGPWAYEFSTIEQTKEFPLTQEGLDALPQWLAQWETAINARPARSLAEDSSRRTEARE